MIDSWLFGIGFIQIIFLGDWNWISKFSKNTGKLILQIVAVLHISRPNSLHIVAEFFHF